MKTTEIPLKQWIAEQACKLGIKYTAMARRYHTGRVKAPPIRRVNQRVIYVQVKG